MSLKVTHKYSTAAGTPPASGDIDVGELAINAADAELYTKDTAGNIRKFQNTTTGTADGVNFTQAGTGAVQRTVESKLQDVVSVKDFTAAGVTPNATNLAQALATNKAVLIPKGTTVNIHSSDLDIPDGAVIKLDGVITSQPNGGRLNCLGSLTITGTGQISTNRSGKSLIAKKGNFFMHGITVGGGPLNKQYGLQFSPESPGITSIRIEGCKFHKCNYAILRSGTPSASAPTENVVITGNVIKDSGGDGIEWNRGDYDKNIVITSNVIENTSSTISNAGFAIGVACNGAASLADPNIPAESNKIIIANNVINTCFQGVHVETSTSDVIISNNIIANATEDSGGDGTADSAGIVVYASANVNVSNNLIRDSHGGLDIRAGVYQNQYVGNSYNCTVSDNQFFDCGQSFINLGVSVDSSDNYSQRTTSFVVDNLWNNSILRIQGVSNFKLAGNLIYPALGETGLTLAFTNSLGNPTASIPKNAITWTITDNIVRDALNQVNVTLSDFDGPGDWKNNLILQQRGNNFVVDKVSDIVKPITNEFYHNGSGFPYGASFDVGCKVISLGDSQQYIVTSPGSRTRGSDNYAVVDAANGIISSQNYAWTSDGTHHFGQKITLTSTSPAVSIEGIISKIFISSELYQIALVSEDGNPLDLGSLGNGVITATDEVAYTTL